MKRTILTVILWLTGVASMSVFAGDVPLTPLKTDIPSDGNNHKPHAPTGLNLQCTIESPILRIASHNPTMAIVEIADETGAIVLTEADALNPAMTIDIAYLESGYYTLFITIDDQTFEGQFFL